MNRIVMQDALSEAAELAMGHSRPPFVLSPRREPERVIIRAREALDELAKTLEPEEEPAWRFRDEEGNYFRVTREGDLQTFLERQDRWVGVYTDEVVDALAKEIARRARAETVIKVDSATVSR